MRIAIVIHHHLDRNAGAPGGMVRLREQYESLGHEVRMYSFDDLPACLSPQGRQLLFPGFVAAELARLVRRWRPHVVDASTGDAWLWAALDPRRRSTLLVTGSHGLEHVTTEARRRAAHDGMIELSWRYPLYYGGFHLWEVGLSLRQADYAFLLNRYDRDFAVERLGVRPDRVRIVENGIREEFLGLPLEPTAEHAPLRVALVFSYLPLKGIASAAEGLSLALERHPTLRASYLGTGVDADTVLADFAPHLRSRIDVVPRYENHALPGLLAGHQVVLFPTLVEGFGVALLEAMACGLAPVSTSTRGPREFLVDGENGLLVPPGDGAALALALDRLIDDRALLDRLRRAAHATAQRFTARAAALHRLALYEEGIARKSDERRVAVAR